MDSQETNSNIAEPGRGTIAVKQNPPLPPGVQLRPQGPPPASPRPPLNNYPPGAPRPGAPPPPSQPLRRLDSRPSLGSPVGSTVLSQPGQLRPYGPPRPPGSPFPPRVPQPPNQNPQNQPLLNPQNSGPRFVQPQPGVRGPSPQIGPRPPFAGIQLPQQIQRADSEQRFSSQNGQQSQHIRNPNGVSNQSNQPRSGQDHGVPRQLQRNESTVNLSRQHSSNQDDRQSTKPRIVIENMTEVEKHCPENFGQKKRSEFRDNGDDDDDDVVVDTDKSPKHNGNTNLHNENLIDPSKSPSNKSADQIDSERPSTAKVEGKNVDPHSRSITPSLDDKVKEMPSRPESSRSNRIDNLSLDNSIEESSEERSKQNEIKTPLRASLSPDVIIQRNSPSPAENAKLNDEQQKTPQKSPEISRSSTPGSVVVADSAKGQAASKSPILGKSAEHLSPNPSRPTSALGVCKSPKSPSTPEPQDKMLISNTMTPPRSPQESVKGFDNGQRRSLSSRSSPNTPSPQTPNPPNVPKSLPIEKMTVESEKKKATFADNEDSNAKIMGEETSQTSGSKRVAKHRAQTPNKQEIQNNSANKALHGNLPITNGVSSTPKKSSSREGDKKSKAGSPVKSPSKSAKSLPRTPDTPTSITSQDKKKVPMNKIQVGAAPSPNLKTVRSKIGSLENTSYKPGGGKVKIENRKLDFSKAQPKIAAKNEKYMPSGGDKKISQVKLQWNAKSKIGSLENATHKPGGGDKKIETVKLDFKDKAKPKVGSKDNAKHVPGGGAIKSSATPPKTPQDVHNDIVSQKIDIKAESKVGSLDNVKHKPGGGDKKIFNDKDYLRQTNSNVESLSGSGSQIQTQEEEKQKIVQEKRTKKTEMPQPPPSTPTKVRNVPSTSSIVTPRAIRSSLAKSPDTMTPQKSIGSKLEHSSINDTEVQKKKSVAEVVNDKSKSSSTRNKSIKSPTSSYPSENLKAKSFNKSLSITPRRNSSKNVHLPKLTSLPAHGETYSVSENVKTTKISLPKLIESSTQPTRVKQ